MESVGLLVPRNMEIAMHFSEEKKLVWAENEYKIYWYLNAINDGTVTTYGIPAIYYYGTWNEYRMLGMTNDIKR